MSRDRTGPPRYKRIRDELMEEIRENEAIPDYRLPTEAELMARHGVSRMTVNAAIKQLVEEGIVYRVAGKGTFVASAKKAAPLQVGLILPMYWDAAIRELFISVERECRERGFLPTIRLTESAEEEVSSIRELSGAGVSGLIFYPRHAEVYPGEVVNLLTGAYPFVLVDKYLPGVDANAVYSDNVAGGRIGTEFLADLGHASIGILSSASSKTSSSDDRFRGYLEAARSRGLVMHPDQWLLGLAERTTSSEEMAAEIKAWLQRQENMTAVFSFNRDLAVLAERMAAELGRTSPGRLAILSFDDLAGYRYSYVEQDMAAIGREAVRLLAEAMEEPAVRRSVAVPVRLVPGRTT